MQLWDGSLQQMCFRGCFGSRRSNEEQLSIDIYRFIMNIMIHMDHADCWKLHFNPYHSMILRFNWCNRTRFMQMLLIQVWKSLFWGEIQEDRGRSVLHLRLKLKAGWKTFASRFVLSNITMTAMLLLSLASTLFNCVLAAHGFDTWQFPHHFRMGPTWSNWCFFLKMVKMTCVESCLDCYFKEQTLPFRWDLRTTIGPWQLPAWRMPTTASESHPSKT